MSFTCVYHHTKNQKGVSCTGILGPLRLTLVHYELLAKQSLSIGDCLFLPTQLPKTDGATATIRYNPPLHHHMGPHRESTQEHKSKRLRPSKEVRQFFPEDRMLPSTPASTLLQLLHSILMEFAQSDYIWPEQLFWKRAGWRWKVLFSLWWVKIPWKSICWLGTSSKDCSEACCHLRFLIADSRSEFFCGRLCSFANSLLLLCRVYG